MCGECTVAALGQMCLSMCHVPVRNASVPVRTVLPRAKTAVCNERTSVTCAMHVLLSRISRQNRDVLSGREKNNKKKEKEIIYIKVPLLLR